MKKKIYYSRNLFNLVGYFNNCKMVLNYFKSLITILLIFISNIILSQQFNFSNFNIEHGLAQSQVFALYEDSRGNLWVGTDGGGISIFDGINFKNITKDDGLSSSQIRAIYESSDGTIWIGTKDNYLCSYNGVKFTYYNKDQGLTSSTVQAIIEDKTGNLWFGTTGGLFIKRNGKFQKINLKRDSSNVVVQTFLVDRYGKLWIGTLFDGVFINDNFKIKHITTRNGLCNDGINSMTEDIRGNIWIATKYGVDEYDGYRYYNWNTNNGLLNNTVNTVLSDKSGNIWFGYNGNGVSRYNGKEFSTFNEKNGLCYNYIKGIIQDRTGNMWFSTDGAGICKFEGERFVHITEKDGLPTSVVMSIYQDIEGNNWFGTYGNGVCKFDGKTFTHFTEEKNGLCGNLVYGIFQDSKGNMWFGSKGGGLSIYDGKNMKTYNSKNGLSHDYIYSFTEDRFGNIIIASNGGGIMIYDGNTFTKIGKNEGLASDLIYNVFIDNKQNIWLGTEDAGADMIFADFGTIGLLQNKKIEDNQHLVISKKFGISHDQVFSISQDLNGDIWLGTFGGGLCKFNGKRITNYTIRDGLNSNNIYFVYVDTQGFIWAGTEKGLNRITFYDNSEKPVIKHYGKSEGYNGIESDLNAVYEDKNGFLWFGTIKGVTVYHPNSDHPNLEEPLIRISNMKLSFEDTDWSEFTDSLTKWGNIPLELTLPYDKNHLTFNFSGIDQKAPDKVKYQWILEGFDKKWAPASSNNEAIYSYIPPGTYTFKVKACNNDGICNQEPATVHFVVTPPFWSTWWFYTLTISLSLVLIFLFIRWRLNKLKREKEILEQKVEERTIELRKEKQVVEQQSEEIRAQADHLFAINTELEKLSIVAQETDNSVMIADKDGNIEWVNAGFTKLFGYSLDEFKILFGDNIKQTSNNSNIDTLLNDCYTKKESVVYNSPCKTKNGKSIWVQTSLTPILDENGELRKFVAIDADISSIKLAEEEIRQQNEEIKAQRDQLNEAINKLKDLENFKNSLTSMIVHDLKNHLNSIISFSAQVFSEKSMKNINQSGKQMLNMVLNILDVQKFEETKVQLNTNVHNILTVVKSSLNDVSILINEKGLTVQNFIKPQYQSDYDYDIIQRVLINLLTNAIKYTPNGGKLTLNAEPITEDDKDFIKISITDTGTGIPKEMLSKVFDKFTQVAAKKSGGAASTGLGLTFCKMVVEAHGGKVGVDSELGKGSTFFFYLPRYTDLDKQEADKMQIEIEKQQSLYLSLEEIKYINTYMPQFDGLEIFEISKHLNIVNKIKIMNSTDNINEWADNVETAIFNFNEIALTKLLEMIKNPDTN